MRTLVGREGVVKPKGEALQVAVNNALGQFRGEPLTPTVCATVRQIVGRVVQPFIPSESTLRDKVETIVVVDPEQVDRMLVVFNPKNRKARRMLERFFG